MEIRVTGIVIEDGSLLVLNQDAPSTDRIWSLPGGKLEQGETLAEALIREVKEETGLDVEASRLLYVCDDLAGDGTQLVHMTFEARCTGGVLGNITHGADTTPIRGMAFVPFMALPSLGFSERFTHLVMARFPGVGSYVGPKSAIGL